MEDMEKEIEEILAEVKEESRNTKETAVEMNPVNEKKKTSSGKKVLIILLAILLALLIVVLGVLIYFDRLVGLINYVGDTVPSMNAQEMEDYLNEHLDTTEPDFTGEVVDPGDVDWGNQSGETIEHEDIINIMLVGQDRRPGESRARSDAMILCSFNKATKEFTMTSFMRDMYVSIPGYSAHKMNSAFAWGGFSLLNETVKENFGITVDGNFAVDFDSFIDVIDTIGGVDIHLTSSEAYYLNNYFGTWCTEGMNHLNGNIALQYARIRNIGNADFGRTARQRNVINSIIQKCMTLSLSELNSLMERVLPQLSTNMEKSTIMGYAAELLPMVAGIKINDSVRIPADGTYSFSWVSGMSVLMPDFDANRQLLMEAIYE